MDTNTPATPARKALGDFAPKLVELTDKVLFGDVWERPQLSKRDRSLITCAALVATGKTDQMAFHFPFAIENGVKQAELVELITFARSPEAGARPQVRTRQRSGPIAWTPRTPHREGTGGRRRTARAAPRGRCPTGTRAAGTLRD